MFPGHSEAPSYIDRAEETIRSCELLRWMSSSQIRLSFCYYVISSFLSHST
jgi:hypothetical protein